MKTKRKDLGVSYIELSIGFSLIMVISFFLIDAANVLYHYHVLTDRTASFARTIAAKIPQNIAIEADSTRETLCNDIARLARTELNLLSAEPLVQKLELDFSTPIIIQQQLDSPYPTLKVAGKWPLKCIICRFFKPNGTPLSTESTVVVEDSKVSLGNTSCQG